MKFSFSTVILLFFFSVLVAKNTDSIISNKLFYSEISKLKTELKEIEKTNMILEHKYAFQKKQFDSVSSQVSINQSNIKHIADSLKISITRASETNNKTQDQIQGINKSITKTTEFWFFAILAVTLLSISGFFLLRKRVRSNAKNIDSQLLSTNKVIGQMQEKSVKIDAELVQLLSAQFSYLNEERKTKGTITSEVDHKLPLKVGDEIHRMRKRIENMPQDTKGLGALTNSLQRLEEEFNDSGYEIESMLGKKYVDGMKVEARFVDNPSIPKGEEIITDVLRPEIKYNGIVIQVAKIEVGKSY